MNEYTIGKLFGSLPEIDFKKGYHYYLCNIDNYSKALLSTFKSIKSKLPLLKNMAETDEYEGLRMITQTLRRMMSTIGGETIVELAYQVEMALLNDDESFEDRFFELLFTLEDLSSRMEELIKLLDFSHMKESMAQSSYFNYDYSRTMESIRLSTDFIDRKII